MAAPPYNEQLLAVLFHQTNRTYDIADGHSKNGPHKYRIQFDNDFGARAKDVHVWWCVLSRRHPDNDSKSRTSKHGRHECKPKRLELQDWPWQPALRDDCAEHIQGSGD